jgi:RimJ/RimL family protein N-acetyltransferase
MRGSESDSEIGTERLILRRIGRSEADLASLHRIWSDRTSIWWGAHPTIEETRKLLERAVAQRWWLVFERGSSNAVGDVFLRALDAHDRAALTSFAPDDDVLELGYHFHSASWGHGYATEATRLVLETASNARVWAYIVPDNLRSRRVAAKLGFTIIGSVDRHELRHDLWELRRT